MDKDIAQLQEQLDAAAHPRVAIHGILLVSDEDPELVQAPNPLASMAAGSTQELIKSQAFTITYVKRLFKRLMGDKSALPGYYVVVLTESGTALGRRTLAGGAGKVHEWIHLPKEDLRYTTKPAARPDNQEVGAVSISIGGNSYAATGPSRVRAYELVDQQGTPVPPS